MIILALISIFISYKTFIVARSIWKEGNKFSSIIIALFALGFIIIPFVQNIIIK